MATYLITYDLVGKEPSESESYDRYEDLIEAIKSYPPYLKVQFSEWLIKTDKGPQEIFNHLARHLDADDRLLIVKITPRIGGGEARLTAGPTRLPSSFAASCLAKTMRP